MIRFADQQVNVLSHDDISDYHKTVTDSHLFENLQKEISAPHSAQHGTPMIATCGNEVQVCRMTMQACGHSKMLGGE